MSTTTVRRITVGATCAGLAASWACVAPAMAAGSGGFVVGGTPFSLQTDSGKAPSLSPGLYSATLPAQSNTWYAKVTRKPNERIQISFTGMLSWKNGAWLSPPNSSESYTTTIETAGGQQCQSQNVPVSSGTRTGAMPSTFLFIDPVTDERIKTTDQDNDACRKATSFKVSIERSVTGSSSEPMPAQLKVTTVPPVKSTPPRPNSDSFSPMDTSALPAGQKVTPGRGYVDAPALAPRGYSFDAVPGQVNFFKVHLSPGQRLSVGWDAPAANSTASVAQDMKMSGFITTPGLANAMLYKNGADTMKITPSMMGSQTLGMYTAPVNYANADLSVDKNSTNVWFDTDPGWYYVALRLAPDDASVKKEGFKSKAPIPTTLSLRVTGKATDGPDMGIAQPKPGTVSGAPTSSRVSTPVWVGLAALGAAAVGGLAYVLRRRHLR